MNVRRRYTLFLAVFAVALATLFGLVAYQVAKGALERELDQRLVWITGGVAETSVWLNGPTLLTLTPGNEDLQQFLNAKLELEALRQKS